MKKFFKLITASLLVVGLIATLAGCGSQAKEGQADTNTKYIFATEPTFAPFEFQDKDGKYAGFDMDLIDAIAKAEGFQYEMKAMNFDGVLGAVQSGNVDGAISAITIKPERAKKFDFSTPYFDADQSVAVMKTNTAIKSLDDCKGKTFAVQIGTTGAMEAAEVENAKVKTFNSVTDAFLEMQNGGADAVMNDIPVTAEYIKSHPEVVVAFTIPTGEQYGIGINKNKKELLEKVNAGLQKLKDNGEYDKLYEKWFGAQK